MARTPFIGVLVLFLVAFQIVPIGHLRAQVPGTAGHEHLTEVACVDVPEREKRPEFGCFNIGMVTGLHFSQTSVYWHLRAFPSRKAAEAAKSATGIVVEEDGRVWLSEFGPRHTAPRGGEAIAHRRTTAASRSKELHRGSLLRCHAARRQFEGAYTPGPRRLVRAGGRAVSGDSGWCQQGSGRRNHDSAIEYSNGTQRHWYDAPACVRPGHP